MTDFKSLGLSANILRALEDENYTTPTPIQAQFIPAMAKGGDLVGIAQTGTGKTAAFILPLLNRLATNPQKPGPKGCTSLIIAPTRELAAQIVDGVNKYSKFMQISATVVVGGVKPHKQIKRMAPGVDILVATPGRLEDHIKSGKIQLNSTTTIVLDEADQMLDMGFIPAIRRIIAKLPKGRQTVLLSATMPPPIRKLAKEFLTEPTEIAVTPESKPIDKIKQSVMHVKKPEKRKALVGILKGEGVERSIVFTRTKHGANKVSQVLEKNGLSSGAIHGNKSQNQRQKTLAAFKKGDLKVLVATDVAARGIDIPAVSHVINFELPEVPEVYVHRIGRTARAGASGTAISFVDPSERGLLRDVEKVTKQSIPVTGPSAEEVGPETEPAKKGGGQRKQAGGNRQGNRSRGKPRNRKPGKSAGETSKAYDPAAKSDGNQKPKKPSRPDKQRKSGSHPKPGGKPGSKLGSKPKRSRNRRRNKGAAHRKKTA